jgi:hypothetical protein
VTPTFFPNIVVRATFEDAYDGVIRLLNDAERYGFALSSMTLEPHILGGAKLELILMARDYPDLNDLGERFRRHFVVRDLDIEIRVC